MQLKAHTSYEEKIALASVTEEWMLLERRFV